MADFTPETQLLPISPLATLGDYERFVALNWVHPFGSNEAHVHFRGKLYEEERELSAALRSGNTTDIVHEIGDLLWCSLATPANEGLGIGNLSEAPLHASLDELDRYSLEAQIEWTPRVLLGFIPFEEGVTVAEVEQRIHDMDIESTTSVLHMLIHTIGKSSARYRTLYDPVHGHNLMHTNRLLVAIPQTVFLLSRIAQQHAGSNLGEVMEANKGKLFDRVKSGELVTSSPK